MLRTAASLLIAHLIVFTGSAHATVIVHSLNEQKEGLHTTLGATYSESSSTVSKQDYDANFRLSHNNQQRQWLLFGNLAYSDVDGKKSEDSKLIHLRYIQKDVFSDLNFEGFLQHESDDFSLLSSRELVGGGLSILTKNKRYALHTLVGIMHEREAHLTDSAQDKDLQRLSISSQLQWYFDNKSRFTGVIYYQPDVSEFKQYRSTFKANLTMPFNDNIDVVFGYSWQYNNDAFANVPPVKRAFNTGINYHF